MLSIFMGYSLKVVCEDALSQSKHWELVDKKYPVESPPTIDSKKTGMS
jgi:hypothetical protein